LLKKIKNNKLLFIGIHILIGFLVTLPGFPKLYGFTCVIVTLYILFNSKNENEEAMILSSYIVGFEVFARMTKGFVFYETGKYLVMLLLIGGILIGRFKQQFSPQYIFYILLLLLGIVFTQVPEGQSLRKSIVFNLSGPILLGVSAIYFYKRIVNKKHIIDALFLMLLPIVSMITFLFFRTPDLKEIIFNGAANFDTSAGFGPNQVATAIGIGIFIITIFILMKEKVSGYILLDALFLFYFIYRGLLTFSRGGIVTGAAAIVSFAFFYFMYNKGNLQAFFKYLSISIIFIISIWVYTSDATGGMLNNRYTGKNAKGVQKKDITSGRIDILAKQIESFLDAPLGIGVGNGKYKRQSEVKHVTAVSHNEVGRLIEEHGVLGLGLLIGLLIIPIFNIWNANNYQRAFITAFYLFWLLTINHSAMRIAFPGFIYALSLIRIVDHE